jgi:FkbM family methyltransferase
VAISDRDGTRELFYLPQTDQPPEIWYHQLATFFPENIRKLSYAIPDIESAMVSEKVPCMKLETLLGKHGVTKIDLVHIDTEGYDFAVLKQLDLSAYSPQIIIYEHKHLSAEDLAACDKYLERFGYKIKWRDYSDTVVVRVGADIA